jgi:hypothetical protein
MKPGIPSRNVLSAEHGFVHFRHNRFEPHASNFSYKYMVENIINLPHIKTSHSATGVWGHAAMFPIILIGACNHFSGHTYTQKYRILTYTKNRKGGVTNDKTLTLQL